MSNPGAETKQLIRDARAGSDSSLGLLLGCYRNYLLKIADDRIDSDLRPKLAASDVVQGSMLIATREFHQFRGETEEAFRTWLLQILTNHLVDGLRRFVQAEKRRADREVDRGDSLLKQAKGDDSSPSQLACLQEDAQRLMNSIQSLPEDLRTIVQARYLEGLTFPEISARLQIPVTNCRRRWLDAIQMIGEKMGVDA